MCFITDKCYEKMDLIDCELDDSLKRYVMKTHFTIMPYSWSLFDAKEFYDSLMDVIKIVDTRKLELMIILDYVMIHEEVYAHV